MDKVTAFQRSCTTLCGIFSACSNFCFLYIFDCCFWFWSSLFGWFDGVCLGWVLSLSLSFISIISLLCCTLTIFFVFVVHAQLFLLKFVSCKASIIGVSDCLFFIISLTVGCFSLTVFSFVSVVGGGLQSFSCKTQLRLG